MYEESSSSFVTSMFSGTFLIFTFGFLIILIAALWKIFQKAGYKGWEAIIPIYNIYIITKIVGKPWWWLLLCLVPIVGTIINIWLYNMLSKSFGKTEAFTVGLILLPFIFFPILGFGSAKYLGPFGDKLAFDAYGEKGKFDFENRIGQ
ncbi:MAG TPA: DUF5684 domain-containing protein [Niabella sp.]|mgnify:CR=1 FL=1|nr:DUF5684 domain-containing protein [Niabella sp.]HQW14088.1 DUF5684 domain-containing protein [Niabella sp.]HQX19369.1 DUF5684 domain-containing protein [Niabella sp.]HQX41773.1 DUF5684 domain-containing protein [Niabella sp.]HRB05586.1 DUF5684 domain-containing protein [Niabella sp.]